MIRPSNRARASERLNLRTRVETVVVVVIRVRAEKRDGASRTFGGASVRERDNDDEGHGERCSRDRPREGLKIIDGKRGGLASSEGVQDEVVGEEGGCCCCLGRSGRTVDGAGLGDGIERRESRERRMRECGRCFGFSGMVLNKENVSDYDELGNQIEKKN